MSFISVVHYAELNLTCSFYVCFQSFSGFFFCSFLWILDFRIPSLSPALYSKFITEFWGICFICKSFMVLSILCFSLNLLPPFFPFTSMTILYHFLCILGSSICLCFWFGDFSFSTSSGLFSFWRRKYLTCSDFYCSMSLKICPGSRAWFDHWYWGLRSCCPH